jgi:hypothetical protein
MRQGKPATTLENVARSVGSTVGKAVRTASIAADDIVLAAKKVRSRIPKKKARKKLVARAKRLARSTVKATAKKVTRSVKSAKRKVAKRRKQWAV